MIAMLLTIVLCKECQDYDGAPIEGLSMRSENLEDEDEDEEEVGAEVHLEVLTQVPLQVPGAAIDHIEVGADPATTMVDRQLLTTRVDMEAQQS